MFIAVLAIGLASCKKEVPQPTQPTPGIPEKFGELQVGDQFNWSNLRHANLRFEGYLPPVIVQRKLVVRIPSQPTAILTVNIPIDAVSTFAIQLPAEATEIEVQYGAIVKRIPVSSGMFFSPKPEFE